MNKKDIKIAVYKESDGSLINKVVIDGEGGMDMLAEPPVAETRMGKSRKDQDIDDLKLEPFPYLCIGVVRLYGYFRPVL